MATNKRHPGAATVQAPAATEQAPAEATVASVATEQAPAEATVATGQGTEIPAQKGSEETSQGTSESTPEAEKAKRTKTKVEMVLTAPDQMAFETADEDDLRGARKTGATNLDDEIQAHIRHGVAQSWEHKKALAVTVPADAQREVIKRLRTEAEKQGLGLALLNIREVDGGKVRIPFKAQARRKYNRTKGSEK